MVQTIIQVLIVGLLAGLVGIIWLIIRHSFDDEQYLDNKR